MALLGVLGPQASLGVEVLWVVGSGSLAEVREAFCTLARSPQSLHCSYHTALLLSCP